MKETQSLNRSHDYEAAINGVIGVMGRINTLSRPKLFVFYFSKVNLINF